MIKHNPNFEDKLNPLISQGKMSLANAAKLDVTDDEMDGYIAFRIRNHMQTAYDPSLQCNVHFADAQYIYNNMRPFYPDLTPERLDSILNIMMMKGYLQVSNGLLYSVKVPLPNHPLL